MTLAGFEPTIPASEGLQMHALDCVATGISNYIHIENTKKDYFREPFLDVP
jgi:hypothetical protein